MLRRRGPWGFLSGAPGTWPPRHPWQERQIPARRQGRHAEGRRTQPEQLSPVGVLTLFNILPIPSSNTVPSHRWVNLFWGEWQLLISAEVQFVISSHLFSPSCYKEAGESARRGTDHARSAKKSLDEENNVLISKTAKLVWMNIWVFVLFLCIFFPMSNSCKI